MSSYGLNFPAFQKTNSAASSGTDALVPAGFVYKAANDTALVDNDGDFITPTCNDVGNVKIQIEPSRKTTYVAAFGPFQYPTATGDFFEMSGSASKVVKILRIEMWRVSSIGIDLNHLNLVRKSTAGTGGTSTSITPSKFDQLSASSTIGICKYYTVVPTSPGTLVSVITAGFGYTNFNGTNTVLYDQNACYQPIVLRGTAQYLTMNSTTHYVGGYPSFTYGRIIYTEE